MLSNIITFVLTCHSVKINRQYLYSSPAQPLALIGTPKPLILRLFLLNHECVPRKPPLAFALHPRYTPAAAQITRHPADDCRDAHPDRCDALAPGGTAAGAGGQRQAGALHRLRRTGLPAGPHGPHWAAAGLHRRQRLRRRH